MPRRTGLATVLAWGWTLLILLACWLPNRHMPVDETRGFHFHVPHLDKIIHATMFAGFGYLWMHAGRLGRGRALAVFGAGLCLAVLTELGQMTEFVGRDADWDDGLADLVGLGLALIVTLVWARNQTRPQPVTAASSH